MFDELDGPNSYFSACCLLELGYGHVTSKEPGVSIAFIDKALLAFEQLLPPGHSLFQKYYIYVLECSSSSNDAETLKIMASKNLEL